jgi:hypothetical protein
MKMQHHARARGPSRLQRPPAERGVQVVGVYDACSRALHHIGNLRRFKAPSQQARRRSAAAQLRGVALEQLYGLAELLSHERHQVLNDPLLPPGRPIAVVKK